MADTPNNVLVGFVLDRSGSMGNLVDATVEGFNQFIAEIRDTTIEGSNALFSLTTFSDTFDAPFVGIDIAEVPTLGTATNPYQVGGMTALYDAVGVTIRGLEGWLANHPQWSGIPIVAVWTDGNENSSQQWSLKALMQVVDEKRKAGWQFAFLGTGSAAWTEGKNFEQSVGANNTVTVAPSVRGTRASYGAMGQTVNSTRATGAPMEAADAYAATYAAMDDDGKTAEEVLGAAEEALSGDPEK